MSLKLVPLQRKFCGQRINGQITQKTYSIPFPSTLPEGATVGRGPITWDTTKTTVHQVWLRVMGNLVVGGCSIFIPARARLSFLVNGVVDGEVLGDVCISQCDKAFAFDYNITTLIINGDNSVTAEIAKSWGWPTWVEVRGFSCYIVVEYEGVAPNVGVKPPPTPTEQLLTYLMWGAAGAGIIAVAYLGVRIYEARRKKGGG